LSQEDGVGVNGALLRIEGRDYASYFCLDRTLLYAVRRATVATPQKPPPFAEARLTYVLRTAGNVGGPIGRFHLTLDKGAAENLVSFCGAGVRKLDETRVEMSATDFTPKHDLIVLILMPQGR
jgi:hypothetical protein